MFGTFDGVHEGHRSLFAQALQYGDELIVIVGRDSASLQWKGKKPRHPEKTRLSLVLQEELVDKAVLGDKEQSSYRALEELNPDVICLGYDQHALRQDLEAWQKRQGSAIPLVVLKPSNPDILHTSLGA